MRGVLIALGVVTAALPAGGQRAASEIALVESAAPAGAIVLGEVRAEIHQSSLFAKTPARDLADKELRAQAAKLGADAVVDIRYDSNSPLFSKKGFRAIGKAVKFGQPAIEIAAAPAVAPPQPKVEVAPPAPAPETGRTTTFATPALAPIVTPQPSAALPSLPVVAPAADPAPGVAAAPQAVSTVPPAPRVEAVAPPAIVAPPVAQPAPVATAAAPAAPRGPTPEALIVLTAEDLAGRAYDRLGEVKAEARQTSLFPKRSARALMDEQLRAKAAALGADAVVLIRYESYSPLLSRKGASASGIAVKYR